MSLLALQDEFQAYIRGAETRFVDRLATPPGGDGARRMRVYHHAYRARLTGVLREVFEKTWAYLGDEAFNGAVEHYVEAQPSTSRSLDDYGAAFADTLAALLPREPDVAELAWLDWAMRRVFDGPDATPIDPAALAALGGDQWDGARFSLCPTLTIRAVTTNVGALWAGLDAGSPLMPAPLEGPMAVRVWRKGLQPHFRSIDPVEAAALEQLIQGATFAALCEDITRSGDPEPVERAAALLTVWLQDELIVGIAA